MKKNSIKFLIIFLVFISLFSVIIKTGDTALAQLKDVPPHNPTPDFNNMTRGERIDAAYKAAESAQTTSGLLYFLTDIAAAVMTLFAYLIEWGVKIGKEIMNLQIVNVGAQTVLMFANLGFVLAIIVMAFATIFRIASYRMQETLWKLIVAALLVNFSLMIAGAFLSVSNIFSDFFLNQLQGKSLADGLGGLLNPQKLSQVTTDMTVLQKVVNFFSLTYWLKYLVSIFFVLIFTLLIILVFIAIFVMFLIRSVVLAILLIIMPIIWLAWIFPSTAKHWQKWWNEFLRWTFFAPIMLFFMVLVINTGNNLSQITPNMAGQDAGLISAFGESNVLNPGFFAHIGQILIAGALLLAGLFAANSLGIIGAKQAYGAAMGGSKALGNWTMRKGVRTAGWGFAGPSERTKQWATQGGIRGALGKADVAVRSRLSKIPILGYTGKDKEGKRIGGLGQVYRAPEKHRNIWQSVYGGVGKESGLWKKYKTKAEKEAEKKRKKKAKTTVTSPSGEKFEVEMEIPEPEAPEAPPAAKA